MTAKRKRQSIDMPLTTGDRLLFARRFKFQTPLTVDEAVERLQQVHESTHNHAMGKPTTRYISFLDVPDGVHFTVSTLRGGRVPRLTKNRVNGQVMASDEGAVVTGIARLRAIDVIYYPLILLILVVVVSAAIGVGTVIFTTNDIQLDTGLLLFIFVSFIVSIAILLMGMREVHRERDSLINDIGAALEG